MSLSLKHPLRNTLALLFCLLLIPVSGWTKANVVLNDLEPLSIHGETAKAIVKQLETEHYVDLKLDDQLSVRLLTNYLSAIDPGRMFFLQSDVDEFMLRQKQLDDELREGILKTGFDIYNRYLHRLGERLQGTLDELDKRVAALDYSKDEYLSLDREDAPWPKDEAQAADLWRKQLKNQALGLKLAGKNNEEIVELLTKRYQSQLHRLEQSTPEDVFQFYVNALASLYDPHTDYFSPRISKNFQINMSLKLEGIGAVLQAEDDYTKVVRLVPAGPADKQGQLQPADRIVAVGQGKRGEFTDVVGWRLDDVVDMIRGPKGTVVRLQVIPASAQGDDERRVIAIERNEVKLEEQSAQKRIIDVYQEGKIRRIGVIDVPAFYLDFEALRRGEPNYRSTTRDVQKLLDELLAENVEGIVIDLRDNGGGSLAEANALIGLFIQAGPTVQIRYANSWVKREGKRRKTPYYSGPLAVLINRMSASASEIFAGAIQDYRRGIVIGNQSFGKGTVQSINPLQHGQLKLTESKFYRISGDSTQNRGVIPDIEFPEIYDKEFIGESALDNALAWDTIEPVVHAQYFDIESMLPELRRIHEERVAKDPDFLYLQAQLHELEARRDIDNISLNEEKRRVEREKRRGLQLALENKRRVAKGLDPLKELVDDEDDVAEESEATSSDEGAESTKEADPLLVEASHILVDAFKLYQTERVARNTAP